MNGFIDLSQYKVQVAQVSDQFTKVPNWLFDDEIVSQLSDKAYRCLMQCIVRFTTGYGKSSAQIATSVFQKRCNIKRIETVYSCIRELEQLNLIKVERKTGTTNTYILMQNHYGKTVVVENRSTTVQQEGSTTVQPYPNKENFKENFKESISASAPEKTETAKSEKTQKFSPMKFLLENEVTEQTAKEYLDLRAKKKKPVTDKVLKIVIRQAKQAQISNELAFQIITVRGWDSFNAGWNWQETANQLETLSLDFDEKQPQPEQPKWTAEVMEW